MGGFYLFLHYLPLLLACRHNLDYDIAADDVIVYEEEPTFEFLDSFFSGGNMLAGSKLGLRPQLGLYP